MADYVVVLVTCPNRRQAAQLAKTLVGRRLAACVNIVPGVQSLFWWQDRVHQAHETLLIMKTRAKAFEPLRRAVRAHHPYDVPEVIAMPIARAHQPYLRWITSSVEPRG
jgi:periplasmic divalent cation tolerance protein